MKKTNLLWLLTIGLVLFASLSGCKKNDDDDDDNNNNNNGPWTEIGVDFFNDYVTAMCMDAAGNLYAGGAFTNSNGNLFVAKWDGTSWSQLGADMNLLDGIIYTMCIDASNNIYIGGGFNDANDDYYVMKWNGTNWTQLPPMPGPIVSLSADNGSNLYATVGSTEVYMWNGSTWGIMNMGGFTHWANGVLASGSNLYVAGGSYVGGTGGAVAQWNGSGWSQMGDINSYEEAYELCTDANGTLYAAGGFDFQSGYVIKWTGSSWTDLNLNGNDVVKSIAISDAGNLYAGGEFANSSNKFYLAKWNGSSWSEAGTFNGTIYSIVAGPDGKIYVGGGFYNSNYKKYVAVYKE
jgi:hypothetical protein